MPDEASDPHPPSGLERALEVLPKVAAVATAFIAVGQATTSWFTGYWRHETETAKAQKELELAEIKDRSSLAESYLKLILSKDTSVPDRVMLLGALGELKGHPLQPWAKRQYDEYEKHVADLDAAYQAEAAAVTKGENVRKEAALVANIQEQNAAIALAGDNLEARKSLYAQRIETSSELAILRGKLGVAAAVALVGSASSSATATAILTLSNAVDGALLLNVFPPSSRAGIERNVPYLRAALQEYQVSDRKLIAAIVATIAVESPSFGAYEEPVSPLNTRLKPFDLYDGKLGNTQPGDGARYRGRGFIGLTGRGNYKEMSSRLGLGTRLLDSPEDAGSPEVSSRIICAYFISGLPRIRPALEKDDLGAIRKLISGNPTKQLQSFSEKYHKILSLLPASADAPGAPKM